MVKVKRLICALLIGLFAQSSAQATKPMAFFMETDPQERFSNKVVSGGVEDIYASGEITEGTVEKLLAFVAQYKVEAGEIHFNSPGGSLVEGMKLGRAIRNLKFFTTIGVYSPKYEPNANQGSICASACAYAFAGGTNRFLNEYTGKLGIHQFYAPNNVSVSGETVQQVSGLIVAYLDQMGIDAKAFTISTIADRDGMIWLTPDEAVTLRFANNGNHPPVVEIKLAGMAPYLRVEQEHYNVTIRMLFQCENESKVMRVAFGLVTDSASSAMIAENQKRSYLETDNTEMLVVAGDVGAKANDSVVWIERFLTPKTLVQIIKADNVGGWIDGYGAVRYGGSLEMPTVRDKITDFAKQCYEQ